MNANAYHEFQFKMAQCNNEQLSYEVVFCNFRKNSVSRCQEALRCYEREKATYDEQAELVGS